MANNYRRGDKDTRPWGTWEVLDCGETFCVKRIKVIPPRGIGRDRPADLFLPSQ